MTKWRQVRLRYVADLNPPVRADLLAIPETEVSFLPMEAIGEDGSLRLDRTRPVSEVRNGYSYFEDGDIAFAKVTPCFENGKGALMRELVGRAGFGTTEITVLRPRPGTDARFLNYVLQSERFRQLGAGAMTGAGGLKRVPDEFTRDFATAWPDTEDQERIANLLDEQIGRIDDLIAEKEALRQQIEEYLIAKIHFQISHAVPAKRTRLKYIATLGTGGTPAGVTDESFALGTIPWVKPDNLAGLSPIAKTNKLLTQEAALDIGIIPAHSVLVCGIGSVGKFGWTDTQACANQQINFVTFNEEKCIWQYGLFLISTLQGYFEVESSKVTIPICNKGKMQEAPVNLPNISTQREVVKTLMAESTRVQELSLHVTEHIDRLREYRSSLISAAVAGQLDIDAFKEAA